MKPKTKEYTTFDGIQVALITNRAYRINYNGVGYWIPRSVAHTKSSDVINSTSIVIESWWCVKNGLI